VGYTLEDEDGYLGDGPSIEGLRQMKKFFFSQKEEHPALTEFLNQGYTNCTLQLSKECKRLAEIATDKNVRITLKALAADARKAKGIVILTM
jgi:hypothetical protein